MYLLLRMSTTNTGAAARAALVLEDMAPPISKGTPDTYASDMTGKAAKCPRHLTALDPFLFGGQGRQLDAT